MSQAVQKLEGEAITQGKAVTPYDKFGATMESRKGEFVKALPAHITFDKFQRTCLTACIQNPDLLTADRHTLFLSCLKSATDGLLPDGRDAALVIFNTKKKIDGEDRWIKAVQYMPMYAGILKKVRQSGDLAGVETHVVYEKDLFKYALGDESKIEHTPYMGKEARGDIIAVYCIARLKDGTVVREVMSFQDIEKVRKASKAGDDNGQPKGIWKAWYEEMARKTVFRRCAKWLPQNIEMFDHAFDNDASMEVLGEVEGGKPTAFNPSQQTGEVIDMTASGGGEDVMVSAEEQEPQPKQPDLKKAVKEKKAAAKSCDTCVGSGVVHTTVDGQESKGPCPDCKGTGKPA